MSAGKTTKLALMVWIHDDPIQGTAINMSNIVEPRSEYHEYKEGQRVFAKLGKKYGVVEGVIGKIGEESDRSNFNDFIDSVDFNDFVLNIVKNHPRKETEEEPEDAVTQDVKKLEKSKGAASSPLKKKEVKAKKSANSSQGRKEAKKRANSSPGKEEKRGNSSPEKAASKKRVKKQKTDVQKAAENLELLELSKETALQKPRVNTSESAEDDQITDMAVNCVNGSPSPASTVRRSLDLVNNVPTHSPLYVPGACQNCPSAARVDQLQQQVTQLETNLGNVYGELCSVRNTVQWLLDNRQVGSNTMNMNQPLQQCYGYNPQDVTQENYAGPSVQGYRNGHVSQPNPHEHLMQTSPATTHLRSTSTHQLASPVAAPHQMASPAVTHQQLASPNQSASPAAAHQHLANPPAADANIQMPERDIFNNYTLDQLRSFVRSSKDWSKASKLLLRKMFRDEELAGHSITGSDPGKGKGKKPALEDQDKLQALYSLVQERWPYLDKPMINGKLAELLKPSRRSLTAAPSDNITSGSNAADA